MVNAKKLGREIAGEKVDILFYLVIEKEGKRMLKPLGFDTKISLGLVRAILDDTVIRSFYSTLSRNLIERGVEAGSTVQLRARFSPNHSMVDPQLTGTRVLCEVTI
jgi:hypothetical protein